MGGCLKAINASKTNNISEYSQVTTAEQLLNVGSLEIFEGIKRRDFY